MKHRSKNRQINGNHITCIYPTNGQIEMKFSTCTRHIKLTDKSFNYIDCEVWLSRS